MKKLSYTIAAGLSALVIGTAAHAEEAVANEQSPTRYIARGAYMSGGGFLGSTSGVSDYLAERGYSGVKDYAYSVGFGTATARWRVISGFELKGVAWRPTEDDDSRTELYGVNGLWNWGFNVLKPHARARLYPYGGVGAGSYALRLREQKATFDDLLVRPTHDVTIWQKTVALQAGIGFDFLVPMKNKPEKSRVVGVKAGYMWDTSPGADWQLDGVEVRNGPSFNSSGVYAQIILGKSVKKPLTRCEGKGCCAAGGCKKDKK